jgi:hypothetical protein
MNPSNPSTLIGAPERTALAWPPITSRNRVSWL